MNNIDDFPNVRGMISHLNQYVNKKSLSDEEVKGLNNGCYILLTFLFDNQLPSMNKKEKLLQTSLKEKLEHLGNSCFQNSSIDWFPLIDVNKAAGAYAVCLIIKNAYEEVCQEMSKTTIPL